MLESHLNEDYGAYVSFKIGAKKDEIKPRAGEREHLLGPTAKAKMVQNVGLLMSGATLMMRLAKMNTVLDTKVLNVGYRGWDSIIYWGKYFIGETSHMKEALLVSRHRRRERQAQKASIARDKARIAELEREVARGGVGASSDEEGTHSARPDEEGVTEEEIDEAIHEADRGIPNDALDEVEEGEIVGDRIPMYDEVGEGVPEGSRPTGEGSGVRPRDDMRDAEGRARDDARGKRRAT